MGLSTFETEITSLIPLDKAVDALVKAHDLPSKEFLRAVKRTVALEETSSGGGGRYKTVKHMVEAPDKDNFIYSHSIVEGDVLANAFERISHEVKITALPEGGLVWKNTSKYFTDGVVEATEEKKLAVKEKADAMFRNVEAFVRANAKY